MGGWLQSYPPIVFKNGGGQPRNPLTDKFTAWGIVSQLRANCWFTPG